MQIKVDGQLGTQIRSVYYNVNIFIMVGSILNGKEKIKDRHLSTNKQCIQSATKGFRRNLGLTTTCIITKDQSIWTTNIISEYCIDKLNCSNPCSAVPEVLS